MGRGFSEEEAKCRVDAQAPVAEAERQADYIVYNDRDLEDTRRQVKEVYSRLKEEARGGEGMMPGGRE